MAINVPSRARVLERAARYNANYPLDVPDSEKSPCPRRPATQLQSLQSLENAVQDDDATQEMLS
ncbi:hypothetical protein AB9F34_34800, partial [Rhizobium leguminosarum]|uniref:hypothetical protein n=1 Tax=Rhizobium leguminosarum TaxID=384 RepID=UPI003F993161